MRSTEKVHRQENKEKKGKRSLNNIGQKNMEMARYGRWRGGGGVRVAEREE